MEFRPGPVKKPECRGQKAQCGTAARAKSAEADIAVSCGAAVKGGSAKRVKLPGCSLRGCQPTTRPNAPSGPWTQCYVAKASSCTITGLTSGTQYWFQICAIGAAGPSVWSDPATKRAT